MSEGSATAAAASANQDKKHMGTKKADQQKIERDQTWALVHLLKIHCGLLKYAEVEQDPPDLALTFKNYSAGLEITTMRSINRIENNQAFPQYRDWESTNTKGVHLSKCLDRTAEELILEVQNCITEKLQKMPKWAAIYERKWLAINIDHCALGPGCWLNFVHNGADLLKTAPHPEPVTPALAISHKTIVELKSAAPKGFDAVFLTGDGFACELTGQTNFKIFQIKDIKPDMPLLPNWKQIKMRSINGKNIMSEHFKWSGTTIELV